MIERIDFNAPTSPGNSLKKSVLQSEHFEGVLIADGLLESLSMALNGRESIEFQGLSLQPEI